MELAETGLSTAQLNIGLLLDKYEVFESKNSYFARDIQHETKKNEQFSINKYLAFNYFKYSLNQPDTQDEAMLKLGDFYYYGIQPLSGPQINKAAHIYKFVE